MSCAVLRRAIASSIRAIPFLFCISVMNAHLVSNLILERSSLVGGKSNRRVGRAVPQMAESEDVSGRDCGRELLEEVGVVRREPWVAGDHENDVRRCGRRRRRGERQQIGGVVQPHRREQGRDWCHPEALCESGRRVSAGSGVGTG